MELLEVKTEEVPRPTESVRERLRVIETNPRTDPRWESFVIQHPSGSIYHHPAWLEALEREYNQKGVHLACEDGFGQVLAILPLLYTRGLPFSIGGPITARRLSSLPRTPMAGPLSVDPRATVALLQEAVQRVTQSAGVLLQIKSQGRELEGSVEGLICTPWRQSYLLPLSQISDGHFHISNKQNRDNVRWAIKKATRLGVYTRPAETEVELELWYRIYLETMRRNVVPPRPYRFFVALWKLLQPRGMMQLLLAEQELMGRRRIVAGSVFLRFGRTVSYAFNASRRGDRSLEPNDLIQWEAISEACRSGFRVFDFGEVPEGNEGLARFKKKWGAEPVSLYRYYYPACQNLDCNSADFDWYLQTISKGVWRHLPLAMTSFLGDWIYARL